MIKKLIIGLFVLNVLYFSWMLITGKVAFTTPPKYEEGIPSLTLLPTNTDKSYKRNATSGQSSCYAFGPFDIKKTAETIANKINGFGFWTDIKSQQTMQTLNYFVYLQPFDSEQDALNAITEISKHEIKEYTLIDSGTYKNAIGLGSFTELDQARRHSEYVRFLGYDARYTTQKKRKRVYWIHYDEPFGTNVPVIRWTKEVNKESVAQKIPKSCV